ncbi:MAG: glycerophosphodiester phosphodiesterase family protein [Candidatus Methanomethylicia archaeon]
MIIVGHRGCAGIEPENTLRSILKAVEYGVEYVEVDVRTCKTGEIVVIHDATVDRTTNGVGYVRDLSLNELKNLNAGKGEKIPTLEEAIDVTNGKCGLIVEIKEENIWRKTLEIIEEKGMVRNTIIASFYHTVVKDVKTNYPDVKCGVIFTCEPVNPSILALDAKAEIIIPNHNYITQKLITNAHKFNLKIIAWTVNKFEDGVKLLKQGVDGLATDRPDIMVKLKQLDKS